MQLYKVFSGLISFFGYLCNLNSDSSMSCISNSLPDSSFAFSTKLFQHLVSVNKLDAELENNIIVSPANIFKAFLMVFIGTARSSREQLRSTMCLHNRTERDIVNTLWQRDTESDTLKEAGRIYKDDSLTLKERFRTNMRDNIESVDFMRAASQATQDINQWVSSQTDGRITELFKSDLPSGSKLVIVTTVHFENKWEDEFMEFLTRDKVFTNHKGEKKQVQMMSRSAKRTKYLSSVQLDSQVVSLPYQDKRYSYVIFLPTQAPDSLTQLMKKLTRESIRESIRNMTYEKVEVSLPKYKTKSDLSLKDTLVQMGIKDIFDGRSADFSEMTDIPVSVDAVIHAATIEVNEEGTVASAATGILMVGASFDPVIPKTFTADHPFVYLIYDHANEFPIFMGTMLDPTLESE